MTNRTRKAGDHIFGPTHRELTLANVIRPAKPSPTFVTVYHVDSGPVSMYQIDATDAVRRFPKEWSFDPWPTAA